MNVKLRERKLAKGVIKFHLDIYTKEKRTFDFLDIKIYPNDTKEIKKEKRKIAELIRSNKEIELLTNSTNYIPKHLKNINFLDFADTYIKNYQKKDGRMLIATLNKFKKFNSNKNLKITEITTQLMYGYKDYLIDKSGLKGESPHNYFTRFKKILKEAKMSGFIKENPADSIKFSKKVSDDVLKKQVLNSDELKKLVDTKCGNIEVKKAFLFACYTGLGLAELKNLKWENIVENRLIAKREKTKQPIDIKLKDNLLQFIGPKGRSNDIVFNLKNKSDRYLSTNAINKSIKKWVEKAGIEKHITFYCARHTFATQLLQFGANLKTVSDALAQTSTRSTIKYLNYIDNLKDDAVDNLPNIKFN